MKELSDCPTTIDIIIDGPASIPEPRKSSHHSKYNAFEYYIWSVKVQSKIFLDHFYEAPTSVREKHDALTMFFYHVTLFVTVMLPQHPESCALILDRNVSSIVQMYKRAAYECDASTYGQSRCNLECF